MMEKNIRKETITDLTKEIILVDDKVQYLYGEISKVKAIFQAVHYSTVEGGITATEADEALTGIGVMLGILMDKAEETMNFSNELVKEVI